MKNILTCCALFITLSAFSQNIGYVYDNAGNRVQRLIIQLSSGLAQQNQGINEQVVSEDDFPTTKDTIAIADSKENYDFLIYPNPTVGQITIVLDTKILDLDSKEISIYDSKGVFIKKQLVSNQRITLDLSNYTSGQYFIRLNAQGFKHEWVVLKE